MTQGITERGHAAPHPTAIGKQAVIVGAGIAGLAAAGALADWFEQVIVLERDRLPDAAEPRAGTPQSWHTHGLLVGGQMALEELFPQIGEDLARAGAVPIRINQDLREELPNREPMPQPDFGLIGYTMTRPLIEATLRRRALQRSNVTLRQNIRVLGITAARDGQSAAGVQCMTAEDDEDEIMPADLVIDASGRGHLTASFLQSVGRAVPQESKIGVDLGYTTAILDIPGGAPSDWKVVITHDDPPRSSRRAVMLPIEGNRWIITLSGHNDERPPGDWDGFLDGLRQLPTRTIFNAIGNASPVGKLVRFGFRESRWRHFERLESFPNGLLPVGDAICRFNPVYGQGMSVAATEASLLHRLLGARAAARDPLGGLGQAFLSEAKSLIETPWRMAAIPDFAFPETRGDRPADLEHSLQFARALSRLAARDTAVQKLMVEVWHMLKPLSVYQNPVLKRRIEAEMLEMAAA